MYKNSYNAHKKHGNLKIIFINIMHKLSMITKSLINELILTKFKELYNWNIWLIKYI